MKKITLYWQNKGYEFNPAGGWPGEIKALFPAPRPGAACSFGRWSCPRPDQQLSYLDRLIPPRKYWLATYYCARGAARTRTNETRLGAIEVTVQKVSRVKRKIKKHLVDFSDVLNLGCRESENG